MKRVAIVAVCIGVVLLAGCLGPASMRKTETDSTNTDNTDIDRFFNWYEESLSRQNVDELAELYRIPAIYEIKGKIEIAARSEDDLREQLAEYSIVKNPYKLENVEVTVESVGRSRSMAVVDVRIVST